MGGHLNTVKGNAVIMERGSDADLLLDQAIDIKERTVGRRNDG